MGYRIGLGEVEESLMGHAAVADCAVIGVPDEIRGHVVKTFVVLKDGHTASDELKPVCQKSVTWSDRPLLVGFITPSGN